MAGAKGPGESGETRQQHGDKKKQTGNISDTPYLIYYFHTRCVVYTIHQTIS